MSSFFYPTNADSCLLLILQHFCKIITLRHVQDFLGFRPKMDSLEKLIHCMGMIGLNAELYEIKDVSAIRSVGPIIFVEHGEISQINKFYFFRKVDDHHGYTIISGSNKKKRIRADQLLHLLDPKMCFTVKPSEKFKLFLRHCSFTRQVLYDLRSLVRGGKVVATLLTLELLTIVSFVILTYHVFVLCSNYNQRILLSVILPALLSLFLLSMFKTVVRGKLVEYWYTRASGSINAMGGDQSSIPDLREEYCLNLFTVFLYNVAVLGVAAMQSMVAFGVLLLYSLVNILAVSRMHDLIMRNAKSIMSVLFRRDSLQLNIQCAGPVFDHFNRRIDYHNVGGLLIRVHSGLRYESTRSVTKVVYAMLFFWFLLFTSMLAMAPSILMSSTFFASYVFNRIGIENVLKCMVEKAKYSEYLKQVDYDKGFGLF